MEEREEIQVVIRKEVLIRGFLYLLNKEGLINNKTYLATLEYLENEMKKHWCKCSEPVLTLDVFVPSPSLLDAFVPCMSCLWCIRSEPYSVDAFAPSKGSGEETRKYAGWVKIVWDMVLSRYLSMKIWNRKDMRLKFIWRLMSFLFCRGVASYLRSRYFHVYLLQHAHIYLCTGEKPSELFMRFLDFI